MLSDSCSVAPFTSQGILRSRWAVPGPLFDCRQNPLREKRQVPDSDLERIVNSVTNCRSNAHDRELANAFGSEGPLGKGALNRDCNNLRYFLGRRQLVIHEGRIDDPAIFELEP